MDNLFLIIGLILFGIGFFLGLFYAYWAFAICIIGLALMGAVWLGSRT